MRTAPALAIAATILWATGCATYQESNRAAADRALESTLRAEMSRYGDLAVNAPNVHFDARDGTVTMTGNVRTEKDREMLRTMVQNTGGVVAVNDHLKVLTPTGLAGPARIYSQPVPATPPAPIYSLPPPTVPSSTIAVVPSAYPNLRMFSTTPTDEVVARRIGEQLASDGIPAAPLSNVNVIVSGDNAYVQGLVDSYQTRQAIVSSVGRASGVRAVYDQLQVR